MGGSTSTQNTSSSSQTNPWAPTLPVLNNLIGQIGARTGNTGVTGNENAALDALTANARAGNPYAPAIGGVATSLLGGGIDRTPMADKAYQDYQRALTPFARGDYVDPANNPVLQSYLDTIRNDVTNSVNGQFAAAGRDLSGMNSQTLARGIAQGEAPVLLDAYNKGIDRQTAAINSLYGAGNSSAGLLSNLDQTRLANQQAGIGASNAALQARDAGANALLSVEALRRALPLQNISQLQNLIVPMAQLGNSSSGNSTSTTTQSQDPTRAIIGAGIAGLGLATGNPMMLAQGGGGILAGLGGGSGFTPSGAFTGNYFPQNPYTFGAGLGFQPGFGAYPMF